MRVRNLNTGEARERLAEIVEEAAHGATRTVLLEHREPVVAVVSIATLSCSRRSRT